jgi:hypothetical protein
MLKQQCIQDAFLLELKTGYTPLFFNTTN